MSALSATGATLLFLWKHPPDEKWIEYIDKLGVRYGSPETIIRIQKARGDEAMETLKTLPKVKVIIDDINALQTELNRLLNTTNELKSIENLEFIINEKLSFFYLAKDPSSLYQLKLLFTQDNFNSPQQRFSTDFWKGLASALEKKFNTATKLSFEGTWISEEKGLIPIIQSLKDNQVTSLSLRRTSTGKSSREEIKEISSMLSVNKTITYLDLAHTFVGYYDTQREDIENIGEIIENNRTLKSIDLYGTYVEKDDLRRLEDALSKNSTLNTINLGYTNVKSSEELAAFEKRINANRKPGNLIKVIS